MESLANLESFARSVEAGSFSAAARQLSLTPAAVSRNVATLERRLGVRLFHRSTRRLQLTEAGERLFAGMGDRLAGLQAALVEVADADGAPAGTLRVSMPTTLGTQYVMPALAAFRARYPAVVLDLHLDNRPVDLVAEGFDVAIGGGFALSPSTIVRGLAPLHLVVVAAPAWLAGRPGPESPEDLAGHDGIVLRLAATGRPSVWTLRAADGREAVATMRPAVVVGDPGPAVAAALSGLGVAILALSDVLPHLASGALVRLLPDWHADLGNIALYHATPRQLPRKARVFSDHVADHFRDAGLAARFRADR